MLVAERLPRARGDGPFSEVNATAETTASPRSRGWTLSMAWSMMGGTGFPAKAGMHPRDPDRPFYGAGFPANAGMDALPG